MPSTPPRRRAQRPSDNAGFPLVPILIGVIVLGFVIGAGWSLLANRHQSDTATVALSTATLQSDTLPSITPVSASVPEPSPSPLAQTTTTPSRATPSASHTPKRAASPEPTVSALPTVKATAIVTTAATTAPTPKAAPSVVALATRAAAKAPPPPPLVAATAHAVVTPLASASATAVDVPHDFDRLAAAVVRQYLEAVKRGDSSAAYAALGASPGDRGASLTEAGIVDAHTRIGRIDSHGTSDTATVEVDLQTAGGPYYGEYTVRKNDTGAAVIVQHSLVKP